MADQTKGNGRPGARNLVVQVRDALRDQITQGLVAPGTRLPSEARLTQDFGVSRTVVREAIAALRADGLVEPRQGAGVFVLEPRPSVPTFGRIDPARVSSLIEMLELRTAVEGDAAAFAAERRAPAQEERIGEAFRRFRDRALSGKPTAEADFGFHLSVAAATNNPRFTEFLRLASLSLIPRRTASVVGEGGLTDDYAQVLVTEHQAVLDAISARDPDRARQAMRLHLKNAQDRYRRFLRPQGV
ncbi:MAG: FadR family transcriptional regulator [Paracoccus denitrificans]|nr:MAG: FadR family transcriptional regulator [Paracoccus denitrificans]PZO86342.1 MAG: FadR family transcriptional regulator [Paracoccus denitrificans]